MSIKYAAVCDAGKTRKINQDSILSVSSRDAGLFVVADGMGGHSYGEKASRHIVKKMAEWWELFLSGKNGDNFAEWMNSLKIAVERAGREIYEIYNQNDICGAAMVLLLVCRDAYGILSAGDSRVYKYRGRRLRQLTMDEVWENQPGLTPQDLRDNWERCHGRLYNAVGTHEKLYCSMLTDERKPGTVFLLCSDGLYKFCSERDLKKYIKKAKNENCIESGVSALLSRVYEAGAKDNVSIILVQV